MRRWIKWAVAGALLALPAAGFAVTSYQARAHCPSRPDCPCQRK